MYPLPKSHLLKKRTIIPIVCPIQQSMVNNSIDFFFGFIVSAHFRCKHMFLIACFEYKQFFVWFFLWMKGISKSIQDEPNNVCMSRCMALSGSKWLNLSNKVNLFPADHNWKKKRY